MTNTTWETSGDKCQVTNTRWQTPGDQHQVTNIRWQTPGDKHLVTIARWQTPRDKHQVTSIKSMCQRDHHFLTYFFSSSVFTTVLSGWDFSKGNLSCLPQRKPAATESHYQPTVQAGCFSVSIIQWTLDMDSGIFNMHTDVNACDCMWGCIDTIKRVCTESWLWEKNPLQHWGIEPASAACQSNALPTVLHPHAHFLTN